MIAMLHLVPMLMRAIRGSKIPRIVAENAFDDLNAVLHGLSKLALVRLRERELERVTAEIEAQHKRVAELEEKIAAMPSEELLVHSKDERGVVAIFAAHRMQKLGHVFRADSNWHCIHCGTHLQAPDAAELCPTTKSEGTTPP